MVMMRRMRSRTPRVSKRNTFFLVVVLCLVVFLVRKLPRGRRVRWRYNTNYYQRHRYHRRPSTNINTRHKPLGANGGRPDLSRRFALLLSDWRTTTATSNSTLLMMASQVGPGVAVDAVLHDTMNPGGTDVVVDVGANGGYPTTISALRKRSKFVLAIDPDVRNVRSLLSMRARFRASEARMAVVNGAAGSTIETMRMAFHKSRTDFSCFRCLDPAKADVFTADVAVKPVDTLLSEHNIGQDRVISLLKTDTQGHEANVIEGAKHAFARHKVNAVLVEFDPRLLGKKETALHLLTLLDDFGMKCIHLKFSVAGGTKKGPPFDPQPIHKAAAENFYTFAVARGGWTDLLCLRI